MRVAHRTGLPVLVLLSLLTLLLPLGGNVAVAADTVGASTVTYGADWAPDPNSTGSGAGGQITLTHQTLANTSYTYIESPWVDNHIPDNAALMENMATVILTEVGVTPAPPVLTGNLADGTLWHLYTGTLNGQAHGVLFTVDTADPSQMDIMTMLASPVSEFPQALGAVQQGITVNDASPLAGIDTGQVTTALQGGTAPAAGTTPVAGTTPPAPTGGQSITVSGATITYNDRWIFDTVNSTPDSHTFWDAADGSATWYGYLPTVPTSGDAAAQLEAFNAQYFDGTFQNIQQVALEPNSPTIAWALTTAEFNGNPAAVLTYVDTSVSGQQRVQMLMGKPDTLQASLADIQQSIQIDGVGAFNGVDSTRIGTLLGGGAPVGQTPAVVATTPAAMPATVPAPTATTVAAGTTPTTAAQPGGALTQTVPVGQDTVAYGGDWQHSAENSSAEVAFFARSGDDTVVYAYLNGPNNIGADPLTAVQGGTDAFFSDFGAQNVSQVTAEVLPSGHAWGLTTFDRNGVPGAFLILADVTTPGVVRAQFLIGPRDQFPALVTSAQQSFQVNGAGAYSEIDVTRVTSLLGGSAPAQQTPAGQVAPTQPAQAAPTQPAQAAPTQPSQAGGGTANYQIEDSPTGCDRIGWVVTDPSQLPASQADLDARGSCAGGATYVASCGTYLVAETSTAVQCTVNVAVVGAPTTVSYAHFTLVDAAGTRYPVDFEALISMVMLLGVPELPEATVDAGSTSIGTVVFNVPNDAPTPWIIEVAPETIATTGEQPGVLVIDGPLQDFDVFGQ